MTREPPAGVERELLACPFCGGEADASGSTTYSDRHEAWFADGTRVRKAFFVNCIKCGCRNQGLIGFQTREEAIAAWNTRALTAAPSDPAVELRQAGWSVAVHNDYRLDKEAHTFWLWTHPDGSYVKGEGRTDADALAQCLVALSPQRAGLDAGVTDAQIDHAVNGWFSTVEPDLRGDVWVHHHGKRVRAFKDSDDAAEWISEQRVFAIRALAAQPSGSDGEAGK